MSRPGPRLRAVLLSLLVSACAPTVNWDGTPPAEQLRVDDEPTVVVLPRLTPGKALPTPQIDRLRLAVAATRPDQVTAVDVEAPAWGNGTAGTAALTALAGLGVSSHRIRTLPADPTRPQAGAVVTVHALTVTPAPCDRLDRDALLDERSITVKQYKIGCISAGNLGAMVADPRDLTAPRPLAADDAQSAGAAVRKLRAPDATADKAAKSAVLTINTTGGQ